MGSARGVVSFAALLLTLPLTASAFVAPMPLEYFAHKADLVVIAVAAAPRNASEAAVLRVERTLKGASSPELSLVNDDSGFECDISDAEPGERALFFLNRSGKGYRILGAGRGKLTITANGRHVSLWSRDEYHLARPLADACKKELCPLSAVLKDIGPFLKKLGPTAFIVDADGNTISTPSRNVRCGPVTERGLLSDCEVASSDADAGALRPMTTDLLCPDRQEGRLVCFVAS